MQNTSGFNNPRQQQGMNKTGKHFDSSYLEAKKSIDDRALNYRVWETLRHELPASIDGQPLKILEVGTGIGTMLERLVDWGLLVGTSTYLATDMDVDQLLAARHYLSQWARTQGHSWSWDESGGRLSTAGADITLILYHAQVEDLAKISDSLGPFDLIIAHAVLDLVDLPTVLPTLLSRLTAGGLVYFSCNFDGVTVFLPEYDGEQDIIRRYHDSMEARTTGACYTGRRLLTLMQQPNVNILAAGSSDWVIHPRENKYSHDETFFLHAIIETVENELSRDDRSLPDRANLTSWARVRHQQVDNGQLSFLARHLDLLAQYNPS